MVHPSYDFPQIRCQQACAKGRPPLVTQLSPRVASLLQPHVLHVGSCSCGLVLHPLLTVTTQKHSEERFGAANSVAMVVKGCSGKAWGRGRGGERAVPPHGWLEQQSDQPAVSKTWAILATRGSVNCSENTGWIRLSVADHCSRCIYILKSYPISALLLLGLGKTSQILLFSPHMIGSPITDHPSHPVTAPVTVQIHFFKHGLTELYTIFYEASPGLHTIAQAYNTRLYPNYEKYNFLICIRRGIYLLCG